MFLALVPFRNSETITNLYYIYRKETYSIFTKLFAAFFKTIIIVIVIAVIGPIAYFGYRLTRPMDLPEFKGLSYIQFVQWRTETVKEQATKFKPAFSYERPADPNSCIIPNAGSDAIGMVGWGPVTLLADFQKGRLVDLPYDWYEAFENSELALAHLVYFPNVAFCDLPLSKLPTPVQFEAMQNIQTASHAP